MQHQETLKQPTAAGISLAEWLDLPEDEPGEVVGGRIVEEEVPNLVHEMLVILLGSLLRSWVSPRGGLVTGSGMKLAVAPESGRKPDLAVFLPGTLLPSLTGLVETPPDLAVEIVSPSPRDGRRGRVEKVEEYAAFGIRHFWILDPQLRSLEILELGGEGRYEHALGATEGLLETVPGCEGLTLDLDALWSEVDALERRERSQGETETAE